MVSPMNAAPQHLDQPVTDFTWHDFAQPRETMTANEALEAVRQEGIGEKIVYFTSSMMIGAWSACSRRLSRTRLRLDRISTGCKL